MSRLTVALFAKILLLNFYAQGQNNGLNLIDSTMISFVSPTNLIGSDVTVKQYDNCVFVLKHYNDTLHKFDPSTNSSSYIVLDIRNELKHHFYPDDFIVCNDTIHLITANRSKIVRLNQQGKYVESIEFKKKNGFFVKSNSSVCYVPETYEYVIPVETKVKQKDFYRLSNRLLSYYQRTGLIGRFDTKGKLRSVFGQFDSIFHDGKYQAIDDYDFDCSKDHLVTHQSYSSKVEIYHLTNGIRQVYDLPGKWINQSYSLKEYNRNSNYEAYYNIIIETNYYYQLKKFGNDSVFCRSYTVAIEDTTSTPIDVDGTLACGYRSQRELNQETLIASKKSFFQIFDLNGKVIYDDIAPFKGTLLFDLNSNIIFTYRRDGNSIKIYKYNINSVLN